MWPTFQVTVTYFLPNLTYIVTFRFSHITGKIIIWSGQTDHLWKRWCPQHILFHSCCQIWVEGQGHMAIWKKVHIFTKNLKFVHAESQKPQSSPRHPCTMKGYYHWSFAPNIWLVTLTYFSPSMTPLWKNRFFLITRKIINRFQWCWPLWKAWLGAQICLIYIWPVKFKGQGHIPVWRKIAFF